MRPTLILNPLLTSKSLQNSLKALSGLPAQPAQNTPPVAPPLPAQPARVQTQQVDSLERAPAAPKVVLAPQPRKPSAAELAAVEAGIASSIERAARGRRDTVVWSTDVEDPELKVQTWRNGEDEQLIASLLRDELERRGFSNVEITPDVWSRWSHGWDCDFQTRHLAVKFTPPAA